MSRKTKFTPEEKNRLLLIILKEINPGHRYVKNYAYLQGLFKIGL